MIVEGSKLPVTIASQQSLRLLIYQKIVTVYCSHSFFKEEFNVKGSMSIPLPGRNETVACLSIVQQQSPSSPKSRTSTNATLYTF